LPPHAAEILGWIEAICEQGVRRPGSAADAWCERFVAERFKAFGLEEVRLEPVPVSIWEPGTATLTLEDGLTFKGSTVPYSAAGSVEAPLVEGVAAGGLAMVDVDLMRLPIGRRLTGEATTVHDPDGDFEHLVQVLPFGPAMHQVLEPALDAGAAGFVGLLSGLGWETGDYYVPYDARRRDITAAWFSRSDAARLREALGGRQVRGRLASGGEVRQGTSHNVLGVLPGRSDEWVVIGSHHDGPYVSAVEDASGVALVLAQAAHWSQVPREERQHNLLFLVKAAHMAGSAGSAPFFEAHAGLLPRTVLAIHLEHAAAACDVDAAGRLQATAQPEPRWWFTSRNPRLEEAVITALRKHDLRRSLVLRPDIFAPFPPTDGGIFHSWGVPLVDFLAAPMYLFDPQDTVDKIHVPSLEPVTAAVMDIVRFTAGETAASMRAAIVEDGRLPIPPADLAEPSAS